jgi:rubrerythrin
MTRANPTRLLQQSRSLTWQPHELPWGLPLDILDPSVEEHALRFLVNLVTVERMAGDLFALLAKRMDDPMLKTLLNRHAAEEVKHAQAFTYLADRINVRKLHAYHPDLELQRLHVAIVSWATLAPASQVVTAIALGEVMLELAQIRPLGRWFNDPVAKQVFRLVSQDEARHVAFDIHLLDHLTQHPVPGTAPWRSAIQGARLVPLVVRFIRNSFAKPQARLDDNAEAVTLAAQRFRRLMRTGAIPTLWFSRAFEIWQRLVDTAFPGRLLAQGAATLFRIPAKVFRTV